MKTADEVKVFLKENVSGLLKITAKEIQGDIPLDTGYGLGSMDSLTIGAKLEDWLEIELDVNLFFEFKTINELTEAVVRMNEAR